MSDQLDQYQELKFSRRGRVVEAFSLDQTKIAVAESLTAGMVTAALADVPGASAVLAGGVVAYQTSLKHRLLGVDKDLLDKYGAVHAEVAEQMALGVRERLAEGSIISTVGISTTGVAGPDWQDDQPPGTVYIGLATDQGVQSFGYSFGGSRADIREATVSAAIDLLWNYIQGDKTLLGR